MKKEIFNKILYSNLNNKKKLVESFLRGEEFNNYKRRLNQESFLINDNILSENNQDVIELINNNQFEVNNINEFKKSLSSGDRGEFLNDYTEDEYGQMKTYKIKGYNVGFAIKSDGDIVSVHNNSGIGGIGKILMKKAIAFGGTKLDHFDGFLTGFYESLGFKVYEKWEWNDDYAPSDWKYEPVDPFNPNTSAYANELNKFKANIQNAPKELKNVVLRYKQGRPDVILRKL